MTVVICLELSSQVQQGILLERLNESFLSAKYLKCHTGQKWELAGVTFEVLQTHEDAVTVIGHEKPLIANETYDFNNSSTVLKITYQDASFMVLGDINNAAENLLLQKFSTKTLKAQAMQVAHHMINNLPALYQTIAPDIALVPQSVTRAHDGQPHYQALLKTVEASNVFFASCATDVFEVQQERFKLVGRYPIEGYLYDGSTI